MTTAVPPELVLDSALRARVEEQLRAWKVEGRDRASLALTSSHLYHRLEDAGFLCVASFGGTCELQADESVMVSKVRRQWRHPESPAKFLVDQILCIYYTPERFGQVTYGVALLDDYEQLKLSPGLAGLLEGKDIYLWFAAVSEPANLDFQSWKNQVLASMGAMTVSRAEPMLDALMEHLQKRTSA